MYRVVVKSRGKYNNVAIGTRYCFTKKSAASLAALFHVCECDYTIEKFSRLHGDIFSRSEHEVSEKVWEKMWEIIEKDLDNSDKE
jgi:hypothetical protein